MSRVVVSGPTNRHGGANVLSRHQVVFLPRSISGQPQSAAKMPRFPRRKAVQEMIPNTILQNDVDKSDVLAWPMENKGSKHREWGESTALGGSRHKTCWEMHW